MKIYKSVAAFLIFTALVAIMPLLLTFFDGADFLVPHFWAMFTFMAVITLIIVVFFFFVQQKNNEMYAQAFLGATTFKLLVCLFFVLIIIKKTHPAKLFFVLDFMYLYFFNTVFEICYLLRTLRNQNLK